MQQPPGHAPSHAHGAARSHQGPAILADSPLGWLGLAPSRPATHPSGRNMAISRVATHASGPKMANLSYTSVRDHSIHVRWHRSQSEHGKPTQQMRTKIAEQATPPSGKSMAISRAATHASGPRMATCSHTSVRDHCIHVRRHRSNIELELPWRPDTTDGSRGPLGDHPPRARAIWGFGVSSPNGTPSTWG